MNKKTAIIICTIVLTVLILSGLLFLKFFLNKRYDFTLESNDHTAYFTFKKSCRTAYERNYSYTAYRAALVNDDSFFEDYVKNRSSYLYSVNESNIKSFEETGNYLFFEDNHYYYISVRDGFIYGTELSIDITYNKNNAAFVSFPFIDNESHINGGYGRLKDNYSGSYSWEESPGFKTFDDIVEFYERITDFEFEHDAETQTLILPLYYIDNVDYGYGWDILDCPEKLQIKVTDEQILVEYLGNHE